MDCHAPISEVDSPKGEGYSFVYEPSLTGEVLKNIVIQKMKSMWLLLARGIQRLQCNRQCSVTDGCSVIISEACGAIRDQKESSERCTLSLLQPRPEFVTFKVLFGSGRMKLDGGDCGNDTFFSSSSKRNAVLRCVLKGQLSGLCETHWVERHRAVMEFNYPWWILFRHSR